MIFTSSLLLLFTCTWMLSECILEDVVYAVVNEEAKLYFNYSINWKKIDIQTDDTQVLASIQKTSTDWKISSSKRDGIYVTYMNQTDQVLVTIKNVSSSYNGTITMFNETGRVLKLWRVHLLERQPKNPFIVESSPPWAGKDYQLSCSGNSIGVSKYVWYMGGQLLTPDKKYDVIGDKLTIKNIQPEDSTNLTCVLGITDDIKSNNSPIFFLHVRYGPRNIKITSEPPDFDVEEGKSITLFCDAMCYPPCLFQWSGPVNAMGASLEIQNMTSTQSGRYTCTATNPESAVPNNNQINEQTVDLNTWIQISETSTVAVSSDGTNQDTSRQSSGGGSSDSNLLKFFYTVLMISISFLKTIVFE